MKRVGLLILMLALAALGQNLWGPAAAATTGTALTSSQSYGPYTCMRGYVWREAFPNDFVCVLPDWRMVTAAENKARVANRFPTYPHPDKCRPGFVWRQAGLADYVCVSPASRNFNQAYNRSAVNKYNYPPGLPARGAYNYDDYGISEKIVGGSNFTPNGKVSLSVYYEGVYAGDGRYLPRYGETLWHSWNANSQGKLGEAWSPTKACLNPLKVHLILLDERTGKVSNAGPTKLCSSL
ncbi:hypothetical protein [Streptosporangium sp. 'caverna']|uniref:hypothetical protein n=1 Tax=Streptosporangium sp. 'caverna' TaxID=2202249 RepID=UPI0013A6C00A|nr:hypothetical protein [Streptosporangium sp. 'caverna']